MYIHIWKKLWLNAKRHIFIANKPDLLKSVWHQCLCYYCIQISNDFTESIFYCSGSIETNGDQERYPGHYKSHGRCWSRSDQCKCQYFSHIAMLCMSRERLICPKGHVSSLNKSNPCQESLVICDLIGFQFLCRRNICFTRFELWVYKLVGRDMISLLCCCRCARMPINIQRSTRTRRKWRMATQTPWMLRYTAMMNCRFSN